MFHHIHTNLFQLNANKEKNVISQNEMRQPEKLTSSGIWFDDGIDMFYSIAIHMIIIIIIIIEIHRHAEPF